MQLQEEMIALVRAFGLHKSDQTPCGCMFSVTEGYALMEIRMRGPLMQKSLASCLDLEKSTVSRLVRTMEQRGWLKRMTGKEDGRTRLLDLTEKGMKVALTLANARRKKFQAIMKKIPAAQHASVLNALHILSSSLL